MLSVYISVYTKCVCFLTRCLYFHQNWWKKIEKKSTFQILLKDVKEEKNLGIHKYCWLSIIWILKKPNSLKSNYLTNYLQSKTTFLTELIKSHIRQLELSLTWKNLYFILIIALSFFGFELLRVNFSCSHFFSLVY